MGSGFTGVPGFTEDTSSYFHLFGRTTGGTLDANRIAGGSSTWLGWASLGSSLAGS